MYMLKSIVCALLMLAVAVGAVPAAEAAMDFVLRAPVWRRRVP